MLILIFLNCVVDHNEEIVSLPISFSSVYNIFGPWSEKRSEFESIYNVAHF
jgi:hypothetical protein